MSTRAVLVAAVVTGFILGIAGVRNGHTAPLGPVYTHGSGLHTGR